MSLAWSSCSLRVFGTDKWQLNYSEIYTWLYSSPSGPAVQKSGKVNLVPQRGPPAAINPWNYPTCQGLPPPHKFTSTAAATERIHPLIILALAANTFFSATVRCEGTYYLLPSLITSLTSLTPLAPLTPLTPLAHPQLLWLMSRGRRHHPSDY